MSLNQTKKLLGRAGSARGVVWFPLVLFGGIILGSTPLYFSPALPVAGTLQQTVVSLPAVFPGGIFTASASRVSVFWLVAGPLAYLAIAVFYWFRERRYPAAYVLTGLGLYSLVILTTLIRIFPTGDFAIRGLTPLIAVALGIFVLAVTEHSWPLAMFAVPFLILVLVANLYDMENLVYPLGLGFHGPQVNVIVVGAVLLVAGVGFGLVGLVADRREA